MDHFSPLEDGPVEGQVLTVTAFEQLADGDEVFFQHISAGSGFSGCFPSLIVVVLAYDHYSGAWIGKKDFSRCCDSVYLVGRQTF